MRYSTRHILAVFALVCLATPAVRAAELANLDVLSASPASESYLLCAVMTGNTSSPSDAIVSLGPELSVAEQATKLAPSKLVSKIVLERVDAPTFEPMSHDHLAAELNPMAIEEHRTPELPSVAGTNAAVRGMIDPLEAVKRSRRPAKAADEAPAEAAQEDPSQSQSPATASFPNPLFAGLALLCFSGVGFVVARIRRAFC